MPHPSRLSRSFHCAAAALGLAGLALAAARLGPVDASPSRDVPALAGRVVDEEGEPVRGAFVTARPEAGGPAVTVFSGADGGFAFRELAAGRHLLEAHGRGLSRRPDKAVTLGDAASAELILDVRRASPALDAPSSSRLALLPDGETKRRFVLDCTGCHQLNERFALREGRPRTREEWEQAVATMLSFAGPESGFPIIAPGREPGPTAAWLVQHLGGAGQSPPPLVLPPEPADAALKAVITTYPVPPGELPHDVMLDPRGALVVTGMFGGVMYRLDPGASALAEVALPVPQSGPRALEIEPDGTWWVLLGNPMLLARRDAATGEWTQHELGTYPHSVARGADGRLWFNAHFGKDPAWIAGLDPATGELERHDLPPAPDPPPGSPIPYELRAGPDGAIWGSELVGNRVFHFDPGSGEFRIWELPAPHSGPRRLDVAPDGTVWIPEYSANRLARLDSRTGEIVEFELPTPDALPYAARVDRRTGEVWVSEAGADAMALFDPATERFLEIPLPVSPGLVRHFDIDPRTGVVWAATSQAPPADPAILRIELPRGEAAE